MPFLIKFVDHRKIYDVKNVKLEWMQVVLIREYKMRKKKGLNMILVHTIIIFFGFSPFKFLV